MRWTTLSFLDPVSFVVILSALSPTTPTTTTIIKAFSLMDPNVKKEYIMARELAPHLFQEEVHPINFLRTCDFDPWSAADRLARYWKHRKETFGDRWLLPLAQSAYGALLPIDLELMRPGYGIVYDDYMILDHSRLTEYAAQTKYTDEELEASRNRIMFYVLTVTSSLHAQRVGKKLLVAVEGITIGKLWKEKRFWPSRVQTIYFVQHKHRYRDSWTSYWLQFFLDVVKRYFGEARTPVLICTSSKGEMLHQILEAGFPLEIIPEKFGGPWSYATQIDEWLTWLARGDDERNQRVLLRTSEALLMLPTTSTMSPPFQKQMKSPYTIPSKQPTLMPLLAVDYRNYTWD